MPELAFGAYLPDLANHAHPGLVTCENTLPVANGYVPVKDVVTASDPLAGWSGGGTFISDGNNAVTLGGTSTALYSLSGEAWVSQYTVAAGRWRFSQHGSLVVATHGGAPVAYDLSGGSASALGGTPPDAKYSATVGDFTFLAGDPADVRTVTWSGFGNPESWTSGTNQSGSQTLADGSEITGLSGGEFLLLFQERAIYRYDYVGGAVVWQRTQLESEVGCIAPDSIIRIGSQTYFLSERGFMRTDGNSVTPIGAESVDRTFLAAYERTDLGDMHSAVDPRGTLVLWSMPGSPGKIWAYNWTLDRWATIETDCIGVVSALSSYTAYDAMTGTFDASTQLYDDPAFEGGVPLLYVVTDGGELGTLTGANLAAVLKTAFNEPIPGQRTRLWELGLIGDAVDGVTIETDARQRLGDAAGTVSVSTMQTSGKIPVRVNGRYMSFELTIAAATDWTFVQGISMEGGSGGKR